MSQRWHTECKFQPVTLRFNFFRELPMLRWAIVFLVLALISAVLGFTDVAGTSMLAAKITFGVFLVLFVVSLIFGNRTPRALT